MSPNSPQTKKGRQIRSNEKFILIFFTSQALSTRNLYPLVKPSMARFTVRVWSDWDRAFHENVQTSWRTTIDFSNMITLPLTHNTFFDNSWLPKTLQWFLTRPRLQELTPCDFTNSSRWNYCWKDVLLTRLRRSTLNRKRLSTHLNLRNSRDVWNHGKNLSIVVYILKGTTSQEVVKTRSFEKKLFYGHIPQIFG